MLMPDFGTLCEGAVIQDTACPCVKILSTRRLSAKGAVREGCKTISVITECDGPLNEGTVGNGKGGVDLLEVQSKALRVVIEGTTREGDAARITSTESLLEGAVCEGGLCTVCHCVDLLGEDHVFKVDILPNGTEIAVLINGQSQNIPKYLKATQFYTKEEYAK